MPRIYPKQESEKGIERLKADILRIFRANSKDFCLTSLVVKLTEEEKQYSREDVKGTLELLEKEGKIVPKKQIVFNGNGSVYYGLNGQEKGGNRKCRIP